MKVLMSHDKTRFDYSLIVIWIIAILTIFLGSLWTHYEFKLR